MRVNSERRGSCPPLVLIHGIGHRWQAWEPVLDTTPARRLVFCQISAKMKAAKGPADRIVNAKTSSGMMA